MLRCRSPWRAAKPEPPWTVPTERRRAPCSRLARHRSLLGGGLLAGGGRPGPPPREFVDRWAISASTSGGRHAQRLLSAGTRCSKMDSSCPTAARGLGRTGHRPRLCIWWPSWRASPRRRIGSSCSLTPSFTRASKTLPPSALRLREGGQTGQPDLLGGPDVLSQRAVQQAGGRPSAPSRQLFFLAIPISGAS